MLKNPYTVFWALKGMRKFADHITEWPKLGLWIAKICRIRWARFIYYWKIRGRAAGIQVYVCHIPETSSRDTEETEFDRFSLSKTHDGNGDYAANIH